MNSFDISHKIVETSFDNIILTTGPFITAFKLAALWSSVRMLSPLCAASAACANTAVREAVGEEVSSSVYDERSWRWPCGRTRYTGPTGRTGPYHDPSDPSAYCTFTSLHTAS